VPRAYAYIRMSTEEQKEGDSLRRQVELAREYATKHDLDLAEADELADVGFSAFTGRHLTEGALGRFIKDLRQGKVEPGSVLLIENFDRLSRQNPHLAWATFSEIVSAGVKLVTTCDGKVHDSEPDLAGMILPMVSMHLANAESVKKSGRVAASWANRRDHADKKIMTSVCPGWLKAKADRTGYDIIPARAKILKEIFEASASGTGAFDIARGLNLRGVPGFGKKGAPWLPSYVLKRLHDRAVLGEMQPCKKVTGKNGKKKRVPAGVIIKNAYPAVIDESLFHRVQAAVEARRQEGGVRKGPELGKVSNLFQHLAVCHCGWPMRMINKGRKVGRKYLQCVRSKQGKKPKFAVDPDVKAFMDMHGGQLIADADCGVGWIYGDFELSALTFISKLDLSSLSSDASRTQQSRDREALANEIGAAEGKLLEVEGNYKNVTATLTGDERKDRLATRTMQDFGAKAADLEDQIAALKKKQRFQAAESKAFEESRDEIKKLIHDIQAASDDTADAMRTVLHSRLKNLIRKVVVFNSPAKVLSSSKWGQHSEVIDRALFVFFKDGGVDIVSTFDDPTHFRLDALHRLQIGPQR
jgi:DNA invertase Pin-like site-specific DNA recombinase